MKSKKKNAKPKCLACAIVGMIGVPHAPTCKVGAKSTMERAARLLKDLDGYTSEDGDMEGELYEADPHELRDLVYNLAVLAAKAEVLS